MADATRELARRIAEAVESRLGGVDPSIGSVVAEELAAALGPELLATNDPRPAPRYENRSRVVVTANGRNRAGIVARLAAAIDEFDGDIRDLSQTIVGDYFTMLFVLELEEGGAEGSRFLRLRKRLKEVGDDMQAHVVVMHDDILSTMHSI